MTNFILTELDDNFPPVGTVTSGNDSISGLGGNDVIYSGTGDDTVLGGAGDDQIFAERGSVGDHKYYDGGDGSDFIYGGDGADTLIGGAGDDLIIGYAGVDLIQAGLGDDFVTSANLPGSLTDGGEGYDRLLLSEGLRPVKADFSGSVWTVLVNGKAGGSFTGFEQVSLTTGRWDDTLIGGAEADDFYSAKGRDYMDGGAGNDTLTAWGAQVTLLGGAGDDGIGVSLRARDKATAWTLDGGSGVDGVGLNYHGTSRSLLTVTLDRGTLAFVMDGVQVGTATNFERLAIGTYSGRTGSFQITSGSGNDDLQLGAGSARVTAGAGDDSVSKTYGTMALNGGTGRDALFIDLSGNSAAAGMTFDGRGEAGTVSLATGPATSGTFRSFETYYIRGTMGDDVFHGGAGDDYFVGVMGSDTFDGGLGADEFTMNSHGGNFPWGSVVLYGDVAESRAGAGDTLAGFGQHGNADKIDLRAIDAVAATLQDDAFVFIGQAAFTGEGQIRVVQVGEMALIQINTLGSDGAEMEITVGTGATVPFEASQLGADDFLL